MIKKIILIIIVNHFILSTISQTNVCCSICLQNSLRSSSASSDQLKNSIINCIKNEYSATKTVSVITKSTPMAQLLALRNFLEVATTKIKNGVNLCGGISTDSNLYSNLDPLDISAIFQALLDYISSIQEGLTQDLKSSYIKQILILKNNFQSNYGSDITSTTYLPWNSSPNNFAISQIISILNSLSIYANQNFPAYINQPMEGISPLNNVMNNNPFNTNTFYTLTNMNFKSNNNSLRFTSMDFFTKNLNKAVSSPDSTKSMSFGQNWTKIQQLKTNGWTQIDNNGTSIVLNSDGTANISVKYPFMSFQKRDISQNSIFDSSYLDLILKTSIVIPSSDGSIVGNDINSIQARMAASLVGMYPLCYYPNTSFLDAFKTTCPGSCNTSC